MANIRDIATRFPSKPRPQCSPRYAYIGSVPIAVSLFVGRKKCLSKIEHHTDTHTGSQVRVVIQGLGGQGKTQIALEVTRRLYDCHSVLWVDASSESSILKSFEIICDTIQNDGAVPQNPSRKVQLVKDMMRGWTASWILVVDNYDDPRRFPTLLDHLPRGSSAKILITTRSAEVQRYATLYIPVSGLEGDSAVRLLLERSCSEDTAKSVPCSKDRRKTGASTFGHRSGGCILLETTVLQPRSVSRHL